MIELSTQHIVLLEINPSITNQTQLKKAKYLVFNFWAEKVGIHEVPTSVTLLFLAGTNLNFQSRDANTCFSDSAIAIIFKSV